MQLAYLRETRRGKPAAALRRSNGEYLDIAAAIEKWVKASGGESSVSFNNPSPLDFALVALETVTALRLATSELEDSAFTDCLYPSSSALIAPIPRPNRILAIGRNYGAHALELGNAVPEEPIVFMKPGSCVIGPGDSIVIPDGVGRVDFEAELAVVIGKGGKDISEENALSHVTAYTIFNDVTARDKQRAAQEKKHPWFLAKSLDTFGPLGPFLVTVDEIADPHNLQITLKVNGETKQDGSTEGMNFRIPYLIAYLSRWFKLEPGDIIATGTPAGVGPIVPGDSLEIEITGLGKLTNDIIAGT
jgi:2-keto-4-pentenoate hydratase/2-oxohepta-3-ene-1,7-dioic acid hydratase in catechol pathway